VQHTNERGAIRTVGEFKGNVSGRLCSHWLASGLFEMRGSQALTPDSDGKSNLLLVKSEPIYSALLIHTLMANMLSADAPQSHPEAGPASFRNLSSTNAPQSSLRSANGTRMAICLGALALDESSKELAIHAASKTFRITHRYRSELVCNWCGTRPPRPVPSAGYEKLQPIELLWQALSSRRPPGHWMDGIKETFQGTADRLLQTGGSSRIGRLKYYCDESVGRAVSYGVF
jgi:hypothetical protein